MSWTIGAIQFPVPPQKIVKKNKATLKKVQSPDGAWIYGLGADAKMLSLDGEMFDTSRYGTVHKTGIWQDYIRRLERYTERDMAVTQQFLNIAPTGSWRSGSSITTFKDTGDKYVKNNESLYVVFGSDNRYIYYEYDDNMTFDMYNIVSIWVYGSGTEKFSLTFYNEIYASATNGYRQWIQVSGENWIQNVFAMSSIDGDTVFQNKGSPTGWDSIRSIVIEPSGDWNPGAAGYRFDMGAIGAAWEVESPNGYYDGIWMVDTVQYEEVEADTEESFRYRIALVDNTPLYGKEERVVG